MPKDVSSFYRILLVDDNFHGLTARRLLLCEHGYEVEIALSGEEAWEKFNRSPFDIVVTDFRMHGMDGVELIALIRGSDSAARTILLSGFASCLGMTERSTGADHVISKGNREVQDLLRAVKRLMTHPPRRKSPQTQSVMCAAAGAQGNGAG